MAEEASLSIDIVPFPFPQPFEKGDAPEWVGLDLNYDNLISSDEPRFFKRKDENIIDLPVKIYANRIKKTNKQSLMAHGLEINYSKTKFNFISSNVKSPKKSGKRFTGLENVAAQQRRGRSR